MTNTLTETRKRQVDNFFSGAAGLFERLAKPLKPVGTFLDIGCGDGYADLRVAEAFQPRKIILTDIADSLAVQLPQNAEFQKVDVCSPDFLTRFQNKVHVAFCMLTLHEIADISTAIRNLFVVLPIGGVTFILDRTYEGWVAQCVAGNRQDPEFVNHLRGDITNVMELGMDTNKGIRRFWEEGVFPRVPGETSLFFNGNVYTVIYVAKQWGQTKKPIPPDILPQLRQLGYIK